MASKTAVADTPEGQDPATGSNLDPAAGVPSGKKPPQPKPQPLDAQAVADIVQRAMVQNLTPLFDQLPTLVDQRVEKALARIGPPPAAVPAGAHSDPAVAALSMEPPSDTAVPAPGGGKPSMMDMLLPLVMQQVMGGGKQDNNPFAQLAQQLDSLGTLFASMDKIRGNVRNENPWGAGLNAKTALDWAKFGYGLGKTGQPLPEFPTVEHKEAPTDRV